MKEDVFATLGNILKPTTMNPKETTEYIKLRGAAIMFLEAERKHEQCIMDYGITEPKLALELATRLDAARSVLWDVINDKDLTK